MPGYVLHVKYITADETSLWTQCLPSGRKETSSTVYEHGLTLGKRAAKGIIPSTVTAHKCSSTGSEKAPPLRHWLLVSGLQEGFRLAKWEQWKWKGKGFWGGGKSLCEGPEMKGSPVTVYGRQWEQGWRSQHEPDLWGALRILSRFYAEDGIIWFALSLKKGQSFVVHWEGWISKPDKLLSLSIQWLMISWRQIWEPSPNSKRSITDFCSLPPHHHYYHHVWQLTCLLLLRKLKISGVNILSFLPLHPHLYLTALPSLPSCPSQRKRVRSPFWGPSFRLSPPRGLILCCIA